jgi:Spy/CpxP family protein refolding chaperone
MKKKIMTVVLVTGLVAASAASANWNRGNGRGMNYQNCPQYTNGIVQQQLDPAVQEKLDKFFADTQELRKQIAMKQAEKMALLRSDNPDSAAASKITGELFDLRNAMRTQAIEAGVDQYVGPRGMMGGGYGRGFGINCGGKRGGGMMGGGNF